MIVTPLRTTGSEATRLADPTLSELLRPEFFILLKGYQPAVSDRVRQNIIDEVLCRFNGLLSMKINVDVMISESLRRTYLI